jgi:hypothetical protein
VGWPSLSEGEAQNHGIQDVRRRDVQTNNHKIDRGTRDLIVFAALRKFVVKPEWRDPNFCAGDRRELRISPLPSLCMSARLLKRELRRGVQVILKSLTAEEIVEECIARN